MVKALLATVLVCIVAVACASWSGGDAGEASDNPAVGSRRGSSALFGTSSSAPVSSAPVDE